MADRLRAVTDSIFWGPFVILLFLGQAVSSFSQTTNAPAGSRLIEFVGAVEILPSGSTDWHGARVNEGLSAGDRIRTGENSRATVLLSDRSLLRLNPLTVIELQSPHSESVGKKRFRVRSGTLYFFNREKPSNIEFETPLATGAIRGTEFVLTVAPETGLTELELREGSVELRHEKEVAHLEGQGRLVVNSSGPILQSLSATKSGRIQWFLYYPTVLCPDELQLTSAEKTALSSSLDACRVGRMSAALLSIPPTFQPESEDAKVYLAAMSLVVGDLPKAEKWMAAVGKPTCIATSLRTLIQVVHGEPTTDSSVPSCASGWMARSFVLQSKGEIESALNAARQAVSISPEFGMAWARVAELEFAMERWDKVAEALIRAREKSPQSANVAALEGFRHLAMRRFEAARERFDAAIGLEGALPEGWLGRGLVQQSLGNTQAAREDLQVAASMEPGRALLRSYLAKGWAETGEDLLVEKDLAAAKRLDPADPTAWLYSALHHYQVHRLNRAVRDLEGALERNDNRRLFRSRLMLDRDRAIRSADLATLYAKVGLTETALQSAARSVEEDPSEFSGHLFMAQSLQAGSSRQLYDLREETQRQSELLTANLLAPVGGGNLSQFLSQQDYLHYFDAPELGIISLSEYRSTGDWTETATLFGSVDRMSYALDVQYANRRGQAPNSDLESTAYSFQSKQQITDADSLYWQVSLLNREGGDLASHYDPSQASLSLAVKERQEPNLFLGYHHEWSPGSHTLLLVSRLQDQLSLSEPQASQLFFRKSAGNIISVQTDPFFSRDTASSFNLYSVELQQLWENAHHSVVAGARYQSGDARSLVEISRILSPPFAPQLATSTLERFGGYGYYTWKPLSQIHLTAGVSLDQVSFPRNNDLPPLDPSRETRARLSPHLALRVNPWKGGSIRATYSRSLGGLYFDNSVRIEPTQLVGFGTAYRSLLPESAAGLLAGAEFETWAAGFDQIMPRGTYFGVAGELRSSQGDRGVGAFTNSGLAPSPDTAIQVRQELSFTERTLTAYLGQLLAEEWSIGSRYRLSHAGLSGRFPDIAASVSGLDQLSQEERSMLHHWEGFLFWNHPSGLFAQWSSSYYRQSNQGYSPDRPGDSFWQHDVYLGYRFPRRHAELRLGLLNLLDQDYRINPLNWMSQELPRGRTLYLSARFQF